MLLEFLRVGLLFRLVQGWRNRGLHGIVGVGERRESRQVLLSSRAGCRVLVGVVVLHVVINGTMPVVGILDDQWVLHLGLNRVLLVRWFVDEAIQIMRIVS